MDSSLLQPVIDQLKTSFNNQFLSGGLVLMVAGSIGYYLRSIPRKLWGLFLRYGTVVLDVQSSDRGYDWLLTWLSKQEYGKRARRVSVKHVRTSHGIMQTMTIPAKGEHWFFHKGRPLWVSRNKDSEAVPAANADMMDALTAKELITIRTVGRSRKILNDIVDAARSDFESMDKDLTRIYRYKWSNWQILRKPKRPLESIMLPPDANGLIEDMKRFVASKEWYRTMGIPYKRGYLFHGPPGTGKSSTVEAVAGYLGLPIYVLNLATVGNDSLEQAVGSMNNSEPCILLMEDIDTTQPDRDADASQQKVSMGTLLNVLDGVQAADSVILIMTSNRPEVLDGALTRHGRVDKWIEFGMATEEQIKQAIGRFLNIPTLEQCQEIGKWPRPISMAEVQERLKQLALGYNGYTLQV